MEFFRTKIYKIVFMDPWKGKNIFMAPFLPPKNFRSPPFTP